MHMESPRSALPHNIGVDERRRRSLPGGSSQASNDLQEEESENEQYVSH